MGAAPCEQPFFRARLISPVSFAVEAPEDTAPEEFSFFFDTKHRISPPVLRGTVYTNCGFMCRVDCRGA